MLDRSKLINNKSMYKPVYGTYRKNKRHLATIQGCALVTDFHVIGIDSH